MLQFLAAHHAEQRGHDAGCSHGCGPSAIPDFGVDTRPQQVDAEGARVGRQRLYLCCGLVDGAEHVRAHGGCSVDLERVCRLSASIILDDCRVGGRMHAHGAQV